MTLNPLAIGFSLGSMTLDVIAPRMKLQPLTAASLPESMEAAPAVPLPVAAEPALERHLVAVA